MEYAPTPIVTQTVTLPAELAALSEKLSENAHDLWALNRLQQGWTYGKQRDDAKKHHPCLIPYADLPESEKTFDRETALGTIKAILALGYTIQPPKRKPARRSAPPRKGR